MIYFVRDAHGAIKIGTTRNPRQRFFDLQIANSRPLEYLGYYEGDYEEERKLHHRFRSQRLLGEWFEPSPELLELIRTRARPVDEVLNRLAIPADLIDGRFVAVHVKRALGIDDRKWSHRKRILSKTLREYTEGFGELSEADTPREVLAPGCSFPVLAYPVGFWSEALNIGRRVFGLM